LVLEALDGRPERRPVIMQLEALEGDRLLLCSDGLSDAIEHQHIEDALLETTSREECADTLVHLALDAGARDNVTLAVADLVPVVVVDVVPRVDAASGWQLPLDAAARS